jgi:hypothetical protein
MVDKAMNDPVIVYLADKRQRLDPCGWYRFDLLCASLKTVKLFLPPLPVVVFHEDFSDSDTEALRAIVPNVTCEKIDFSGQEQFHVNMRPDGRVGVYGYCMMCRFFSGIVQAHPLVASHSHYMRLDDDCYFIAPVPASTIEESLRHDYTYSVHFEELRLALWEFTVAFMKQEGLSTKKIPKYTTRNSPYTNFHISSLAMWRHPVVVKYLAEIEERHGCLALGWTDSSIQYMIIRLLGPAIGLSVNVSKTFNYRHNLHCCHSGPHTEYCKDGKNDHYPWGPPICLS